MYRFIKKGIAIFLVIVGSIGIYRFYIADHYYFLGRMQPNREKRIYYYERAYKNNPYCHTYFEMLSQEYIISYVETRKGIWWIKEEELLFSSQWANKDRLLWNFYKGVFLQLNNLHGEAIKYYEKAERLDPYNQDVKRNLSCAYKIIEQKGDAK